MNTLNPSGSIPNHLVWSIISTILATCLCCPVGLIGIVAIVFSSKVNTLLGQGDLEGAQRASNTAKLWCWITTAIAIIGLVVTAILIATGGMEQYAETLRQYQ